MSSFNMYFYTEPSIPLTDSNGSLWPKGTVVEVPSLYYHQGLVDYLPSGEQILLHNSKRFRRAVASSPMEFSEGRPYVVKYVPKNFAEALRALQRAWSDIRRGLPWNGFDNCQDFVTRAFTGHNGSKGRNAIVGAGLVFGLLALL